MATQLDMDPRDLAEMMGAAFSHFTLNSPDGVIRTDDIARYFTQLIIEHYHQGTEANVFPVALEMVNTMAALMVRDGLGSVVEGGKSE